MVHKRLWVLGPLLMIVFLLFLLVFAAPQARSEECLWNCPCVDGYIFFGECAYLHYWESPSTSTWGYFISTRVGGDPGPIGQAVDPGLLPGDFSNGGIITGDQLSAAMGGTDYNGMAGDVPPADGSGSTTSDTGAYEGSGSQDSAGAEYE